MPFCSCQCLQLLQLLYCQCKCLRLSRSSEHVLRIICNILYVYFARDICTPPPCLCSCPRFRIPSFLCIGCCLPLSLPLLPPTFAICLLPLQLALACLLPLPAASMPLHLIYHMFPSLGAASHLCTALLCFSLSACCLPPVLCNFVCFTSRFSSYASCLLPLLWTNACPFWACCLCLCGFSHPTAASPAAELVCFPHCRPFLFWAVTVSLPKRRTPTLQGCVGGRTTPTL